MSAAYLTTDSTSVALDDWRELASRESDGLEISARSGTGRPTG